MTRLSSSSTRRMRRRSSGMLNLGDPKSERRAALMLPHDFDRPAVRRGDALHDGQAEPAAARPLRAAAAEERLEKMANIPRRDAGPAVLDGDGHAPALPLRPHA